MKTNTFTCCHCSKTLPSTVNGQTNYGTVVAGHVSYKSEGSNKICFQCVGNLDKADMLRLPLGEKMYMYLIERDKNHYISNFCGTFELIIHQVYKSGHNIAGCRYDFWFRFGGRNFHGVVYGDNTQVAHIKCLKHVPRKEPAGKKVYLV